MANYKYKIIFLLIFSFVVSFSVQAFDVEISERVKGKILLQTEQNGEAWYVNPENNLKYFLGRPSDAFNLMRKLGVGITNKDLVKIEVATFEPSSFLDTDKDGYSDKDEMLNGYNPYGVGKLEIDPYFSLLSMGKIFLQVEQNGEAWYINPVDQKRYFLGRPSDAFNVMRSLGLGITNDDLEEIEIYKEEKLGSETEEEKGKSVLHDVPFTAQAPFGNWSDQRQEDGCEEASVLMAIKWSNGNSLTNKEALEEILAISDFEQEKYGGFNDTSAYNTMERIFKDYYSYDNVEVVYNVEVNDIVKKLQDGNLVIVPVNGQKLGNPYFTQPGPERHMLLIKGWDSKTNEFITNEPGTKRGENYRYKKGVLFGAIRDYVTGKHFPIVGEEKVMIVVSK